MSVEGILETPVAAPEADKRPDTVVEKLKALESASAQPAVTQPQAKPHGQTAQDPAEPKAPSPADDPDMASRFATLAKKEKRLAEERSQLQRERQEIQQLRERKEKAKEDPDAWLSEAGLTLDELIDRKLKGMTEPEPEDRVLSVEEKLKRLEQQLADKDTQEKHSRITEALEGFKGQIRDTVSSNAEAYGLIQGFERIDDVFETCKEYFEQTGEPLELERACKLVEAEIESDIRKALEVPKVRKLLETIGLAAVKDTAPQAKDTKPLTLNNRVVSPTAPEQPKERLSADESKRRAAAWLQAQLNQKRQAQ